jgi:hypothetical protein
LAATAFRTMKTIIVIVLGFCGVNVMGQVTNTTHRDETNIYYNALDSAVKVIQTKVKLKTLIVEGDLFVVNRLPIDIFGVRILKNDGQTKVNEKDADAIVTVDRLEIENGEFGMFIQLWTVEKGQRRILENGISGYTFNYEFLPADKSFKLIRIDKSIIIR